METPVSPFTNAQLEILKVLGKTSDEDLMELKDLISNFYAEKAMNMTDKIWDERRYTQEDMDKWLHEES